MKTSISLVTTLLAFVGARVTQEVADPANVEVVSSYLGDGLHDESSDSSHQTSVDSIGQRSVTTNLRGPQQSDRSLLSCGTFQKSVQLTLMTDKFPKDTTWTLKASSGKTIASSPSQNGSNAYEASTKYQTKYCLDVGKDYILTIKDAWGDGLQKSGGFYALSVEKSGGGWKELLSGGDFRFESVDTFSITTNGGKLLSSSVGSTTTAKPMWAPVPTPSNYAHQNSNNNNKPSASKPSFQATGAMVEQFGGGSLLQFTSRMGCPNNQRKAKFEIKLDRFGAENTWSLQSSDGKVFMQNSRTYDKNDYEVVEKCLPENKYKLIVYDDAGDGICCAQGNGYYIFYLETDGKWEEIFRGGKFKAKKDIQSMKIGPIFMNSRDKEWLVAHNSRRKKYHKQYGKSYVPLKWSEGLKEISAKYAEELLSSCPSPTIIHDPNTSYGENLAKNRGINGWGDLKPADNIVTRFVEREMDDEWPHNAHLTQALWRGTHYVGCAESVMPLGDGMCRIQVCRYARAGNCNVRKNVKDDWYDKMLADESDCAPFCPPEGKF
ncbi:hypothetical protein ACHAW6_009940 [Cyclotella cf. meneghiniana]